MENGNERTISVTLVSLSSMNSLSSRGILLSHACPWFGLRYRGYYDFRLGLRGGRRIIKSRNPMMPNTSVPPFRCGRTYIVRTIGSRVDKASWIIGSRCLSSSGTRGGAAGSANSRIGSTICSVDSASHSRADASILSNRVSPCSPVRAGVFNVRAFRLRFLSPDANGRAVAGMLSGPS